MEHLQNYVLVQRGEVAQQALEGTLDPTDRLRGQVLKIVEHLCTFILDPPYGVAQASEADCLHQWITVFAILKSKNITLHTGEQILSSSKVVNKGLQLEFGDMAESGRRCDMLFRSGAVELANIEIKTVAQSGSVPVCQNRKNVRLNRCVRVALQELGMENATVIAGDIVGQFFLILAVVTVNTQYLFFSFRIPWLFLHYTETWRHFRVRANYVRGCFPAD
ncbi:hypothetical protein BC939DRAFT_261085 [Gamsiella multidivaricata]|uniref:uncharacterized protein n=1 Tax=Gamsiella multidivaricata TaxID=101098 RepID=UPI00221EF5F7|nr:uncharacterized protein BC939DRAFT_261085 [Gamsiella multidivaricata]KAI7830770.1 hypothetical protein BC939DRAFT_261085 [Gamsiella multidivaricata]